VIIICWVYLITFLRSSALSYLMISLCMRVSVFTSTLHIQFDMFARRIFYHGYFYSIFLASFKSQCPWSSGEGG